MLSAHSVDGLRRFLKYELDRYLRGHGGEVLAGLPPARVENQICIHGQQGSLVLHGLKRWSVRRRSTARCLTRLRTGKQTVTLTVAQAPLWVGVEPYNQRIDRHSADKLVKVESP